MADENSPKQDLNRAATGTTDESRKAARMDVIRKLIETVPGMTVEEGLALIDEYSGMKPSMGSIIVQGPAPRTWPVTTRQLGLPHW